MNKNGCIRVYADTNQIDNCKIKLADNQQAIIYLSSLMNMAGNEVRFKMLYLLVDDQKLCVCDLSDILGMKIQAVSQHLRKLRDSGIVQSDKVGQTIFYHVIDEYQVLLRVFFHQMDMKSKSNVDEKITIK
jgi:DNA-binding transcriptional ArsR family regulator